MGFNSAFKGLISTYLYLAESKEYEQAMRIPILSLWVSPFLFRHSFCCKPVIGFLLMLVSKQGVSNFCGVVGHFLSLLTCTIAD